MFNRRHRRPFLASLREWVWPQAGWVRVGYYLAHRLARSQGGAEEIAIGAACGVAVSFTPLIGLHFVLAIFFAWLLKGSIFASILGTGIGNPWTFPFIWLIMYQIGAFLIGAPELAFRDMNWDFLTTHFSDVLVPMMIGAVPLAFFSWVITYFSLRHMITIYRHRRQKAIDKNGWEL